MSTESSSFSPPRKRILSKEHLEVFKASETHDEILQFISELNDSVIGVKLSGRSANPRVADIISILDSVLAIAQDTPPVDNKLSRFGNPAFKTFYHRVKESSAALHGQIPGLSAGAISEISVYFEESWGNVDRVDYGSGMELNFLCWLLCLVKLHTVGSEDYTSLVLEVFWRYIKIMRYLQSTYWLEPAGSHGVWGLDDYQFLPFLFGSGQLRSHKHLTPKAIHDPEILEAFSADYMYLSCVAFINSIKTASLRWHSPMLDDISAVKTWAKVNDGMRKMYSAEVLGKLPVMQHALFGSLLPFPEVSDLPVGPTDSHGHVHEGWSMDCCGIPVPSAFGEAARSGIKPIPFD